MRINFTLKASIPQSDFIRNTNYSSRLGLPSIEQIGARGNLAVVGGGRSVLEHIETLRKWPGEIWAINGAFHWCQDNGIKSTFFTIDPHPEWSFYAKGARRAIVAASCHPSLFDVLETAEVFTFDHNKVLGGATSATFVPMLSLAAGFDGATFFGCESSYSGNSTHVYENEEIKHAMLVECGGNEYLTNAGYYMQADALAKVLREFPDQFKEESGGLLRAMTLTETHDTVAIGRDLDAVLGPIEVAA